MSKELENLFIIQEVLKNNQYNDISRISKEILEFVDTQKKDLKSVLKRIEDGEPWEYIRGYAEFRDLKFFVTRDTLIPRVESEQIVDIAKDILKEKSFESVLDVGTGSGCIIISLAKEIGIQKTPNLTGTDISSKALRVAQKNSVLHKVNKKVLFRKGDLLEGVTIDGDTLILANLPYVPTDMYEKLEKSVTDFEPRNSIDGGSDGLKYYKELLKQIEEKRNGFSVTLVMEIEPSTLDDLKRITGPQTEVIKDVYEKDRFVLVHLP